jgi:hypothetical protein
MILTFLRRFLFVLLIIFLGGVIGEASFQNSEFEIKNPIAAVIWISVCLTLYTLNEVKMSNHDK